MKIIQSFALFDNWTPRIESNDEKKYLNFYSFLLSYLTLKKYYGHVTMYCNENAQKKLIKYVPYDEVKIVENKNDTLFWSYYKVDIIKGMREDFIHVDSDVFIFANVFSPFIDNKNIDIIIQNFIPKDWNYVRGYVNKHRDFIIKNKLINPDNYDERCISCGTVGMRIKHKKGYVEMCEKIREGFIKAKTDDRWYIGMASEELALYFYSLNNDLKIHEILPYADVLKYTDKGAGDHHNYTHMLLVSKFQPKYVKVIRLKILKDFPEAKKYIDAYEKEVMSKTKIINEIL